MQRGVCSKLPFVAGDAAGYVDAAGGGVGEGMGDAAAVTDDVEARVLGFQVVVYGDFHVVELDLYAVEQGVVIGGARGDFIQGVEHFDDAVQNPLGQYQAQVAGGGVEGGGDEAFFHPLGGGTLTPDQVPEPLDDDTAAQHIAQPGDGLAVAVGVLKGLGEMLGNQQGKVGVFRLLGRVFIAVAVDGDDAVGVFVDHGTLGVHAEGADFVLIFLGSVDDFAFVKLVRQVGEYHRGQLHPNADVHPVGLGGDVQILADGFHPFAAAAAYGDHALAAMVGFLVALDFIAFFCHVDGPDGGLKVEIHLVFQVVIQVFQHHIVDVRAQMPDGGIQQVQIILNADGLEFGAGGGVELGAFAAVGHVDLIHIFHQIQGPLFADVFVEGAAKIIGNVVFSVRKCACAAETAHNGAAFAADAAFDGGAVDGAGALVQRVTGLKNADFQLGVPQDQLIGGKNTARARADDQYVVIRHILS